MKITEEQLKLGTRWIKITNLQLERKIFKKLSNPQEIRDNIQRPNIYIMPLNYIYVIEDERKYTLKSNDKKFPKFDKDIYL